jgi:hypothetical protein
MCHCVLFAARKWHEIQIVFLIFIKNLLQSIEEIYVAKFHDQFITIEREIFCCRWFQKFLNSFDLIFNKLHEIELLISYCDRTYCKNVSWISSWNRLIDKLLTLQLEIISWNFFFLFKFNFFSSLISFSVLLISLRYK